VTLLRHDECCLEEKPFDSNIVLVALAPGVEEHIVFIRDLLHVRQVGSLCCLRVWLGISVARHLGDNIVRMTMERVWTDIPKSDSCPYPSVSLCPAKESIRGHGCRSKSKPVGYPCIHGYPCVYTLYTSSWPHLSATRAFRQYFSNMNNNYEGNA
jgi:hypothetical protein